MCMRKGHGEKLLWAFYVVVFGVSGVLLIPQGRGLEEHYEGVEVVFLAILDLSWEMSSRSNFEMMCGAER